MRRIAIPTPTSFDPEYNRLNWCAYADSVRLHQLEPVEIPLGLTPRAVAEIANGCVAVLLPGSPADVNPAKYGQHREETTALADLPRENVDELLLQDAHNLFKPILGICFGAQILNVWRGGTLLQDLTVMPVNHSAARGVAVAHSVALVPGSLLLSALDRSELDQSGNTLRLSVNSSHHQAIGIAGDGLRVGGRCPQDGVIESVEGPQHPDDNHFVLGVQWHPERTQVESPSSHALFARFCAEASRWCPRRITTSVAI